MGIYIYTKKETNLKTAFGKKAVFLTSASTHNPESTDITYLDISGISSADTKKAIAEIKKRCKDSPWGIVDPKGSIEDTAALFFDGASDYLGPGFFKGTKGIPPQRLKDASLWRSALQGSGKAKTTGEAEVSAKGISLFPKTGILLPPASQFPGWKNMQTGKTMPFYILYCSLEGKTALNARLGEKAYSLVHQRLLMYMFHNFHDGDGLIWMDSGKDFVFLLPPKAKCIEAAIEACIRMLLSAPLIVIEVLNLSVPANFIFALHYGSITYRPPGSTGTVVSDAVNFVFHLGGKKAEPGRLTVSGDLPDGSISRKLEDCFVTTSEFEGRKIWHTKKFSYAKPWL